MHPIERLRYVARADGAGPTLLVQEAAGALAGFADDPAALVTACRRLVDRHPGVGPMWWLAARVLAADDPAREAWASARVLDDDGTPWVLAEHVPEDATVTILGWPELTAAGLGARGDVSVQVVDAWGEGSGLVARLDAAGLHAAEVPESGVAAAVVASDLVVLEANALGPDGFVAVSGSSAAAAVGRQSGVGVWVVAGEGRALPGRLWDALRRRLDGPDDPWDRAEEIVPLSWCDRVVGPAGVADDPSGPGAARRADCPVAPELLKPVGGWSAP